MKKSAGLLVYRKKDLHVEFYLVHPGGPFWKNKDAGAWSIPKGEYADDEDPLTAAIREFEEETGQQINGKFIPLQPVTQKGGKMVFAWAVEAHPSEQITSNTIRIEWPYRSGKWLEFPEVDKAAWFELQQAKEKINPAQVAFILELSEKLDAD